MLRVVMTDSLGHWHFIAAVLPSLNDGRTGLEIALFPEERKPPLVAMARVAARTPTMLIPTSPPELPTRQQPTAAGRRK